MTSRLRELYSDPRTDPEVTIRGVIAAIKKAWDTCPDGEETGSIGYVWGAYLDDGYTFSISFDGDTAIVITRFTFDGLYDEDDYESETTFCFPDSLIQLYENDEGAELASACWKFVRGLL